MTWSTTRYSPPAASSRTGQFAVALPKDPGLDEILADPTLGSTAKALVTVMVRNWAWYKDRCWPCDKTLAAKVGKSVGHVQRCLHELERAGRIRREKTDEVPNGRRIWLLWRCPGDPIGAQREMTPARGVPTAPARDEQIVIVKGGIEREETQPTPQRPRSEPTVSVLGNMPRPIVPEACPERPTPAKVSFPIPQSSTPPQGSETVSQESREEQQYPSVNESPEREVIPLSSIGPPSPSAPPSASSSVRPALDQKALIGLTPQQLVRLQELPAAARNQILRWIVLGDSILLNEARKLLAPPRSPEPPPSALPTAELLASLPGRHDRIAHVAARLAADLDDQKSYRYYQALAQAVSSGQHPADALVSAWQQGMHPKAERPGAVFATVWKRETRTPS